jgi:hypothetical protein
MENSEVKYKNRHQEVINTNLKVCTQCNENKKYKDFVALGSDITKRRDICRKCEAVNRKTVAINASTKHCPKCDKILDKTEFSSDPCRLDGLYGICKSCKLDQDKVYTKTHPEKIKEINHRRMAIPHNRIAHNLRTRLNNIVVRKDQSTIVYVGIKNKELLKWLEYLFDDKMSWDNYGTYWQIDHVIPCASFDLTKETEIFKCFNWTNLRPLEKKENNSKNSKILDIDIKIHNVRVEEYKNKIFNKKKEKHIEV